MKHYNDMYIDHLICLFLIDLFRVALKGFLSKSKKDLYTIMFHQWKKYTTRKISVRYLHYTLMKEFHNSQRRKAIRRWYEKVKKSSNIQSAAEVFHASQETKNKRRVLSRFRQRVFLRKSLKTDVTIASNFYRTKRANQVIQKWKW